MLLSLRKNGLTSLFKEVRVFKERPSELVFVVEERQSAEAGCWGEKFVYVFFVVQWSCMLSLRDICVACCKGCQWWQRLRSDILLVQATARHFLPAICAAGGLGAAERVMTEKQMDGWKMTPGKCDQKSLPIAKNHLKTSQEISEQFGPFIHKMKGFSKNSPQKVHPNFAQNSGRQILGETFSGPNYGKCRIWLGACWRWWERESVCVCISPYPELLDFSPSRFPPAKWGPQHECPGIIGPCLCVWESHKNLLVRPNF